MPKSVTFDDTVKERFIPYSREHRQEPNRQTQINRPKINPTKDKISPKNKLTSPIQRTFNR